MVPSAIVGLGANLGDRRAQMVEAARRIEELCPVAQASSLYECDAVGPAQPRFLNAALRIALTVDPEALLGMLLEIERALGRERRERWGPRSIDLDILYIEGTSIERAELMVPHARLHERTFALRPLLDLLPHARDPKSGESYAETLERLVEPELSLIALPDEWCPRRNSRNHG